MVELIIILRRTQTRVLISEIINQKPCARLSTAAVLYIDSQYKQISSDILSYKLWH